MLGSPAAPRGLVGVPAKELRPGVVTGGVTFLTPLSGVLTKPLLGTWAGAAGVGLAAAEGDGEPGEKMAGGTTP